MMAAAARSLPGHANGFIHSHSHGHARRVPLACTRVVAVRRCGGVSYSLSSSACSAMQSSSSRRFSLACIVSASSSSSRKRSSNKKRSSKKGFGKAPTQTTQKTDVSNDGVNDDAASNLAGGQKDESTKKKTNPNADLASDNPLAVSLRGPEAAFGNQAPPASENVDEALEFEQRLAKMRESAPSAPTRTQESSNSNTETASAATRVDEAENEPSKLQAAGILALAAFAAAIFVAVDFLDTSPKRQTIPEAQQRRNPSVDEAALVRKLSDDATKAPPGAARVAAYRSLAQVQASLGQHAEAADAWLKVAEGDGSGAVPPFDAVAGAAAELAADGRFDEAVNEVVRLRKLSSKDKEADYAAALVLAKSYASCVLTDAQGGSLESVLRDGVSSATATRRVGEAVDVYNALMKKQPSNYASYLAKASLLLRTSAIDEAWKSGTSAERLLDAKKLLVKAESLAPDDKARALVAKVKLLEKTTTTTSSEKDDE